MKEAAERGEANISANIMARLTDRYGLEVGDVGLLAFRDIGPPDLDMFGAIAKSI